MHIYNEDLLVVRTKNQILALYENDTELLSTKDCQIKHPMQRGYADTIFWVEELAKGKNALRGVRFEE